MMSQERALEQLRNAIENAIDRKMKSPRDFEFLATAILEKLHQSISTSTLKRIWGYLPQYASIRTSTLNILAQFIDYKDWDAFLQSISLEETSILALEDTEKLSDKDTQRLAMGIRRHTWSLPLLIGIVVLLVGGVFLLWKWTAGDNDQTADSGQLILRRGQIFETSSDYLHLFGITTTEHTWDQPLPHHDGIIIWGPEYHHPQWHNDGERDSLMPTITEWWTPADSLSPFPYSQSERQILIAERNEHLYFTVMRTRELRITFMKNLTDTGYVFLGVYRTNLQQSDSTHLVWERVADECDLSNLAYLQQLRH